MSMEDWWRIRVMLIVDDFGGRSEREMWDQVHEYLKDSLDRDGGIDPFSLGLSVREKSQIERGGSIRSQRPTSKRRTCFRRRAWMVRPAS